MARPRNVALIEQNKLLAHTLRKICSSCLINKSFDAFHLKCGKPMEICNLCRDARIIKYKYGLSPEDFDNILKSQDGKCKICLKPAKSDRMKRLSVDHCHKTGAVRGLLCHKCNLALGLLYDDIEAIKRMLSYLEKRVDSSNNSK